MIYFTADLHFGHENIIAFCNRPFKSAGEMDATLIKNWNNTIEPNDEVYILGDFTMGSAEDAHRYLSCLQGKKYFIRGNHDKFLDKFEPYMDDFEWVKDYFVLRAGGFEWKKKHRVLEYEGKRVVLFHYPILEWDCYFRGAIHLYGHIHNNEKSVNRLPNEPNLAFNVGVDLHNYFPVSFQDILRKAEAERKKMIK